MDRQIEIIIPVRNPTDLLRKTVESLALQEDRMFQVLISDNHSTSGLDFLNAAQKTLSDAGVQVRMVKPPAEIGRVEHWNWSHRQASAEWIKPLFVGDWLDIRYTDRMHKAIASDANLEIIHCSTGIHRADGSRQDTIYAGGFRTPDKVLADAFAQGNCFGGPVNICFRRDAFDLVGGYPPALPVSADFWLILMIALRHGLMTCEEVLAHFSYHPARFSTNFPMKRINGPREFFVILTAATSFASFMDIPHSKARRNRLFFRVMVNHLKEKIKRFKSAAKKR